MVGNKNTLPTLQGMVLLLTQLQEKHGKIPCFLCHSVANRSGSMPCSRSIWARRAARCKACSFSARS